MIEPHPQFYPQYRPFMAVAQAMQDDPALVGRYDREVFTVAFQRRSGEPALLLETVGHDLRDPDCMVVTYDAITAHWVRARLPLSSMTRVYVPYSVMRWLRRVATPS